MFLWHFPSGHPAPPLAGILPGGARTFLPPSSGRARGKDGGRPVTLSRPHFSMGLMPCERHRKAAGRRREYESGRGGSEAEAAAKGRGTSLLPNNYLDGVILNDDSFDPILQESLAVGDCE